MGPERGKKRNFSFYNEENFDNKVFLTKFLGWAKIKKCEIFEIFKFPLSECCFRSALDNIGKVKLLYEDESSFKNEYQLSKSDESPT